MIKWLKKLWNLYMSGADANNYPLSKFGLFGEKLLHPRNLDAALIALDKMLLVEDKDFMLKNSELTVLACLHHSLGRHLRNEWGLWETKKSTLYHWFKSKGIWHADDMSSIILKSYCRKIKGQSIELQMQIQHCIKWWNAQEGSGL